jgi:endonuclease/exonuclease/phosphatase family metal-dependent hydrolase
MIKRLLACAMLALLAGCATISRGSTRDENLRVMTWNIAAGHGDLANIARVIGESGAEIVALQEVDVRWSERSAFVDQADSLARSLHMQVRFAPIYSIRDSVGSSKAREFGVAILSRYPIVDSKNHSITRLSTQQQNASPALAPGFLETTIDVRGTRIKAFSTHLDYRGNPEVRQQQVAEMLEIFRSSEGPMILFGDLNATPTAAELSPLLQKLQDAWIPAQGNDLTYPAEKPVKRIDYVLTSTDFVSTSSIVPVTEASDHRPVIANLRFKKHR